LIAMTTTDDRRRSRRLEVRTTADERALIDRAVAARGGDLTEFIVGTALDEARRVLADRDSFVLTADQAEAWNALNARPARELAGVRALFDRPSPFKE
jgi:uncharacterized protein (DUF1778 family)